MPVCIGVYKYYRSLPRGRRTESRENESSIYIKSARYFPYQDSIHSNSFPLFLAWARALANLRIIRTKGAVPRDPGSGSIFSFPKYRRRAHTFAPQELLYIRGCICRYAARDYLLRVICELPSARARLRSRRYA